MLKARIRPELDRKEIIRKSTENLNGEIILVVNHL